MDTQPTRKQALISWFAFTSFKFWCRYRLVKFVIKCYWDVPLIRFKRDWQLQAATVFAIALAMLAAHR